MIVLGIETATIAVGVGLYGEAGPIAQACVFGVRQQVETLVVLIDEVLTDAGLRIDAIDAVAADVGPGRFTGLRVGLSAAKTLAYARGLPVVGVQSLDVLAHRYCLDARLVVPIVDMRRGELAYRLSPEDPPLLGTPDKLAAQLAGLPPATAVLAVGDGALRYRDELVAGAPEIELTVAAARDAAPDALALAELGHLAARNGRVSDPLGLDACYLRDADVRINWDTRAGATTLPEDLGR